MCTDESAKCILLQCNIAQEMRETEIKNKHINKIEFLELHLTVYPCSLKACRQPDRYGICIKVNTIHFQSYLEQI